MPRMRAKVETAKFVAALRKYQRSTGTNFRAGIRKAAIQLRERSRERAPIDTGALKASGIWFVTGKGWNSVAVVGFGAEVSGYERVPSEYAVIQHDDPFNRKYLEYTLYAMSDEIAGIIYTSVARSSPK